MVAQKNSFPKNQIKVLLLENIHPVAKELFVREGYQVELLPSALSPEQLKEKIRDVHILGIRSKTQVTAEVLADAKRLLTIGAFCIGVNQIDLKSARLHGIPVFNAPFGNTRSVAELVLGEVIALARQLGQRSQEMHQKTWKKTHQQCFEVRGKTLGIVGYGNIGTQVSTLAESLGMNVMFYDTLSKLPRGNSKSMHSLSALLQVSDFVTLHVPSTPQTHMMMGAPEIALMKKGAYLINASRGTVVDIAALVEGLKSGQVGGAALDVYPEEPEGNTTSFSTPLQGLHNVILTPHIGGATEEAQGNIGEEVPVTLIRFVNSGTTLGSVNFPSVDLPPTHDNHRILNAHKNVPGVLSEINKILAGLGANIEAQTLATDSDIGYLVIDTDKEMSQDVKHAIEGVKASIRTRILY